MHRSVASSLAWLFALSFIAGAAVAAPPDEAGPAAPRGAPAGLAARVWEITEAVLKNHVEPPEREVMLRLALSSLGRACNDLDIRPSHRRIFPLASRKGPVTGPEEFAALLDETWDRLPPAAASLGRAKLEAALIQGVLLSIPGGGGLTSSGNLKARRQNEGNTYVGLQVAAGYNDKEKRVQIIQVLEGGPAQRAGVLRNDLVDEIDGVSAEGMEHEEVLERLRGANGTVVSVRFRRPGSKESRLLKVTRGMLPRRTVAGIRNAKDGSPDPLIRGEDRIAYLKVLEIAGSTPHEVRTLARRLEASGARAVVLDLRPVDRADFHSTVILADFLLESGTIGRLRTARGVETFRATPDALFLDLPLAVLAEGNTRGPAEWLAAALQDNHRAVVVGVRTGNPQASHTGTGAVPDVGVQTAIPIRDGTELVEMTTGLLERGDGRRLTRPLHDYLRFAVDGPPGRPTPTPRRAGDQVGLTPDIVVDRPEQPGPPEEDPDVAGDADLTVAVRHMRENLKSRGVGQRTNP